MKCPNCDKESSMEELKKSGDDYFCPDCDTFVCESMEKIDKSEDDPDLEVLKK